MTRTEFDQDNQQDMVLEELGTEEAVVEDAQPVQWEEYAEAEDMRQAIFTVQDIPEQFIDVPEWKMRILVRGMTAKQRSMVLQNSIGKGGVPDLVKLYPDFVIMSCYHPKTRKLIFKPADRDMLNEKAGGVIERIAMTAARLSGIDQKAQADIKKNLQMSDLNGSGTL